MGYSELMALVDGPVRELLGETVTYAGSSGGPVEVRGVFTEDHQKVDAGRAGVSSSGPAVFLRLEDLPSNPAEDGDSVRVTVGAVTYSVREAQPDGLGGVLLLLHKA